MDRNRKIVTGVVLAAISAVALLGTLGLLGLLGPERTCTPAPWSPGWPSCNPCYTIFGEYPTDCRQNTDGTVTCTCVAGTVPGWKCKDAYTVGYQNSDGTWSNLNQCEYGCSGGECNPGPVDNTCEEGWRCKDSSTKGYRLADCTWSNVETCEGGCFGGTCLGGKNVHRIYRTASCSASRCDYTDQDRIYQPCAEGCFEGACVNTPSGQVSLDFAQMLAGGGGTMLAIAGLALMVI